MRSRPTLVAVVAVFIAACGGPTPISTAPGALSGPSARVAPATAAPPPSSAASSVASSPPSSAGAATPAGTASPSPTLPAIGIIGVECLAGQTVRLHVSITADVGVPTYALWSTWGGGGDTTRSFPAPYSTHIDELVELTHAIPDPEPGRIHQFGLAVTLVGVTDPIITYATEPEGRCPGH